MWKIFAVLFLSGYLLQASWAEKTPAQKLMESVNEKDKGLFLKYHLLKAVNKYGNLAKPLDPVDDAKIPKGKCKQMEKITTPDDFHQNLYKWAQTDLSLTTPTMTSLVTVSVVCFSDSNVCYDPNEVGSLCCPF